MAATFSAAMPVTALDAAAKLALEGTLSETFGRFRIADDTRELIVDYISWQGDVES